jgi:NADH-quinone oxidoreductase subunit L
MTVPLIVLAIGAALAGFLGVPEGLSGGRIPNYFEHLLEPSIAHPTEGTATHEIRPGVGEPAGRDRAVEEHGASPATHADHTTEILLTVISSIIALGGIGIGWAWFKKRPLWQPPRLLEEKYYVDEAYDATVVEPIKVGSTRLLWKVIDVGVIDGAVNGAAYLAGRLGGAMRYLQSGLARGYVAVVVLGALLLIGYFIIK